MFSETKITVRYQETDQMGIVHHSVYPVWFECGRTDLIHKAGITYSDMEKEGILLPLLGLKCRYLYPCFYEDKIAVRTSVSVLKPTRITFYYEIFRGTRIKPIATGETEHAWVNASRQPVNLKKYKPDLYQLLWDVFINGENAANE